MFTLLLKVFAVVGLSYVLYAQTTYAVEQGETDKAIKSFLALQKSETEEADLESSVLSDVNADGKSEIVLVWTLLGPTYWHNTLTVLRQTPNGWKEMTSFALNGEAKLLSVKAGLILVRQKVLAKGDPLCCPSVNKLGKYRLVGKRLLEVK